MNRKYYFYKRDNKLLILFFLIIIAVNIIAVVYNNKFENQISAFLSFIFIIPLSFFLKKEDSLPAYRSSILISSKNKNTTFVGIINVNKDRLESNECIIKRKIHISNIISLLKNTYNQNMNRCLSGVVLTGDSGAGKSVLIESIKTNLEDMNYNVFVKKDYYNILEQSVYDSTNGKTMVIILDQFEKAFAHKRFMNKIIDYSNRIGHKCIFVFVFAQADLSCANKMFCNYNIDYIMKSIYVLSLNEEDINDYQEKIARFSGVDFDAIEEYIKKIRSSAKITSDLITEIGEESDCRKLCDELIKVIDGKVPLIELELLGYILSLDNSEFKTYSEEYSFIDIYIDEWVNKFFHPETAYAIIYLMSEFKAFSIDEIRLATFENRSEFSRNRNTGEDGCIIQSLYDNFLILRHDKKDNVLGFQSAHQYISEQFRKYCQNKEMPENSKYYIDYLRKCIDKKNEGKKDKCSYPAIEERFNKYYSRHIGIRFMMELMYIAVLVVNILKFRSNDGTHYQLIAISVVAMPSIYYIYNYCIRFFLISDNLFVKLTYVAGPLVILLSYIFVNAWGILLGSEIIILSIAILFTYVNSTSGIALKSFKNDFVVFISIGITVVFLGIIYYNIFTRIDLNNNDIEWLTVYGYSNYVVFLVYVSLSVLNHMKYSYIIGRIGLANITD